MPPPEKLRRKVLLKGKTVPFLDEDEEDLAEMKEKGDQAIKEEMDNKRAKQPAKIAQELSDLVHLKATSFKGFEEAKSFKPWEMCSFSENKVNKFLAKLAPEFISFNTRNVSRIYPKGMRVDSSNYDPVPSWVAGAQIVALNYQTGAEPTFLNDGKFLDNGNSGYVLKPKYMRDDKVPFNPNIKSKGAKTLVVTIVSGYQLPKVEGKEDHQKGEVIDPFVKIKVRGAPVDTFKSQKTKVVKSNGFNPLWNSEFKYTLNYPDLAVLFLAVSDADLVSKNDFIGQYVLPITCIREGYRSVPLKDTRGTQYEKASLLLHFKWV